MESYWITIEATRRGLVETDQAMERHAFDRPWHEAEYRLRCSWDRYSAFGSACALYRDAVIKPLHDRFNAGDRSFALLSEILSI